MCVCCLGVVHAPVQSTHHTLPPFPHAPVFSPPAAAATIYRLQGAIKATELGCNFATIYTNHPHGRGLCVKSYLEMLVPAGDPFSQIIVLALGSLISRSWKEHVQAERCTHLARCSLVKRDRQVINGHCIHILIELGFLARLSWRGW